MLLLTAWNARGSGINLSWNECGPSGSMNRNFACNTNSGAPFVMIASFDPPDGITKLVGGLAVIDIGTAWPAVPSWWHFVNPGACRENSLTLGFPPSLTCVDPWAGSATGGLGYTVGFCGNLDVARLYVSFEVPEEQAGPVETGTEYYAFSIAMDRANTVGVGACAGCLDPECIVLNRLTLFQSMGLGDHLLTNPRDSNFVTWQGGVIPLQCPGYPLPGECTPTLRNTWGQIKSLYR